MLGISCQPPVITAEYRSSANDICEATSQIAHCVKQQLLPALHRRATALANSAQISLALNDAAAIQSIMPSSPLGYLCAGMLHAQQGQQLAAISIFDDGLEEVAQSDPGYRKLEEAKEQAEEKLSRCFDMLRKLPVDVVVTNIVPRIMGGEQQQQRLSSNEQCAYLYVSRLWRKLFLQHSDGLQFYASGVQGFAHGHDQLVKFAPHVRSLLVGEDRDDNSDPANLLLLPGNNLVSLQQLHIRDQPAYHDQQRCVAALQSVGTTLTHLEMPCRGWSGGISIDLGDILATCPNLVSLKTTRAQIDLSVPSLSDLYPKLLHLELLRLPDASVNSDKLLNVMKRVPALRTLKVEPVTDGAVLDELHNCCPFLQQLAYGSGVDCTSFQTIEVAQQIQGLRSLSLGEALDTDPEIHTAFMIRHRNTLESLECWRGFLGKSSPIDNQQLQFIQLRTLRDLQSQPTTTSMLECIIDHAPNLETIELRNMAINEDVLNCLLCLRHIDTLELSIDPTMSPFDHDALTSFIDHHVELGGTRSTLRELKISLDDYMFDMPWMRSIAELAQLERLTINLSGSMSILTSNLMWHLAAGCRALEQLKITCDEDIADSVIYPLSSLRNLKHLALLAEGSLDDQASLFEFYSLKRLELRASNISQGMVAKLKEMIPVVEVL